MKAFISYSHRDADSLSRLHTHLAMLRREGQIEEWFDREILPGTRIDQEISTQLASSGLFLALVSPDFLASNYCYEREMQAAIKRHEAGSIVLVPVILQPCDWLSSPMHQFKAIPKDGRPISEWTNENSAYLDVVTELRKLIQSLSGGIGRSALEEVPRSSTTGGSKYRVKKTFDQIDLEDFKVKSFETIREYFEKSVAELASIEGLRGRFQSLGPLAFTCTVINQNIRSGRGTAHITVRAGSNSFLGDISFSYAANAPENTANGSIRVDHDEYQQFLRPDFLAGERRERAWTAEEVRQKLWEEFLKQAGISYD